MALLKIATVILILFAGSILCSLTVEPLPVIEDPLLMTVWGESIELLNINYFCDSLQIARDYSPAAKVEDLNSGAGLQDWESYLTNFIHSTLPELHIVLLLSLLEALNGDRQKISLELRRLPSSVKDLEERF